MFKSANALSPIDSNPSASFILVNEEQAVNILLPRIVSPSLKVTLVIPEHEKNALAPYVPAGKVISPSKNEQYWNAFSPIYSILFPKNSIPVILES